MKIPQVRQLPSGSWFCRVRVNGQDISITKSTEKEAIAEAVALKTGMIKAMRTPMSAKTLSVAIDEWLADNEARLSPSTVRGYVTTKSNGFPNLMRMRCDSITDQILAREINRECKKYSAKTVVNRWRFLSQVLQWATGKRFNPNLPQVVTEDPVFFDQEELAIFLDSLKGTKAEIVALLALSSLRRSEIAALDWRSIDLKNRWIHVKGAVVPDKENAMVEKKTNKNATSRRYVPIIEPLYQALLAVEEKTGKVVPIHPATMWARINKACRDCGLPEVGCHGLRHSFASLCHIINIPPQVAMEIGGWSDRATMDRIYTHVSKRTKDSYANAFTAYFSPIGNENGNGN